MGERGMGVSVRGRSSAFVRSDGRASSMADGGRGTRVHDLAVWPQSMEAGALDQPPHGFDCACWHSFDDHPLLDFRPGCRS